jgi:probable HAF family extracellular repeat protein
MEANMKSKTLPWTIGMTLCAALAMPVWLAAQDQAQEYRKKELHHYKLIDLGTLGGPSAYRSVNAPGYQIINNAGVIAFAADTTMLDPNAPNCFLLDCFVGHAARWKNGEVTDLGALPGNGNGSASGAINAHGWIAGQSQDGEIDPATGLLETRATLWKGDQVLDLGTFGGHWSLGLTLNDKGEVVGFASNAIPDPLALFLGGTQTRAFLWRDGVLQDLGTLGGNDAEALSVNQRGQVAGISYTNSTANDTTGIPTLHPFLWEHGRMIDLGTLGGTYAGSGSCSFGAISCNSLFLEGSLLVNNRGQVMGTSSLTGDQTYHPFLWENGNMKDLGTLGGDTGVAVWLTETGDVVGYADLPSSPAGCVGLTCIHHGFLWKHGEMADLGTLGADPCNHAFMSNAKGQVVGTSEAFCGGPGIHPFLWENGGPMVDLNTLIPENSGAPLYEASNINERGEIVAGGLPVGCGDPSSCGHAYLLIPCDEEHPDIEGCDYGMIGVDASIRTNAVPVVPQNATPSNVKDRPLGLMTNRRFRAYPQK